MPRFKCPTCDKWHEELPDVGYDRPAYANGVPESEQQTRLFLTSDLCVIDDKDYFVRCVLPLPIRGTDEQFMWGVWSSLSKQNFLRYQASYDDNMSDWEPMFGYLSNRLPGYPDTLSLKLSIQPQEQGARPIASLDPTDHPLAIEQRDGIALEKVLEIVAPFLAH